MQLTPKLNLKKPDLTDSINVQDLNDNMDVLDTAVSELQEGSASIPDLETNDKTLAGAINEIKQTVNDVETNAKEYTDQQTAAIDTALNTHKDDITSHNYYATTVGGTANQIEVTINADITSYKSGLCVTFFNSMGANVNGNVVLNVNKLGTRHVVKDNGSSSYTPGEFPANQFVTVRILPNNGNFRLVGESGVTNSNGSQIFSTPGTHSFTVPAGVKRLMYKIWGAGGGGGGSSRSRPYIGGGGGGGGAYASGYINVIPGTSISLRVGTGGVGGAPNTNTVDLVFFGGDGTPSSIAGGPTVYGGRGGTCAYWDSDNPDYNGRGGRGAQRDSLATPNGSTNASPPKQGLPLGMGGYVEKDKILAFIGGTDGSYTTGYSGGAGAGGNSDAYGGFVTIGQNSNPQTICNIHTGGSGGSGGSSNGTSGYNGDFGAGGGGASAYSPAAYTGDKAGGNGGNGRIILYW